MKDRKGMDVIYTNCDQFINKRDDLSMAIAGNEPDLIPLTECIPKAQTLPISPSLLALEGYTIYMNFDPTQSNLGAGGTRGNCIFVRDSLKATQVFYADSTFNEQLWVKIKLADEDHLIVGCLYRSPSRQHAKC